MQRIFAIVHLNETGSRVAPHVLDLVLGALRGVQDVAIEPEASVVRVLIDHEVVGLPDIVRCLEDAGLAPVSIALRVFAPVDFPMAHRSGARHIRRRSDEATKRRSDRAMGLSGGRRSRVR